MRVGVDGFWGIGVDAFFSCILDFSIQGVRPALLLNLGGGPPRSLFFFARSAILPLRLFII